MLERTRVLLVGNDQDTCTLAALLLSQAGVFEVVGAATHWTEMANLLLAHAPQLVLLDLDSPGQGVLESLKMARLLSGRSRFVGLASGPKPHSERPVELDALLPKELPVDQVVAALGGARREEQPPTPEDPSGERVAGAAGAPGGAPAADPADGKDSETEVWSPEFDTLSGEPIPAFETINLEVGPFRSFRSLAAFQEALGRLEGVKSVKVRRFHRGTLYATVHYHGILPLAERLAALTQLKPRVVAEQAGSLQVRIDPEETMASELLSRAG